MMDFYQGDIIRIAGLNSTFMIVSKNAFIRAAEVFHVCPVLENYHQGPIHIAVEGKNKTKGCVICEQIKLIDPAVRTCRRTDRVSYDMIMNVSDVLQGLFEYD